MSKFVFKKATFLLFALLTVQLLVGCALAISQEQYNSVN